MPYLSILGGGSDERGRGRGRGTRDVVVDVVIADDDNDVGVVDDVFSFLSPSPSLSTSELPRSIGMTFLGGAARGRYRCFEEEEEEQDRATAKPSRSLLALAFAASASAAESFAEIRAIGAPSIASPTKLVVGPGIEGFSNPISGGEMGSPVAGSWVRGSMPFGGGPAFFCFFVFFRE